MSLVRKSLRRRWPVLLLSVWVFALAIEASLCCAASTVFSTGFEAPYVPGALQGQPTVPPLWVTAGVGGSTAIVESPIASSGSQAVEVTKAAAPNTDRRWAVQLSNLPTQRYIMVDWDMSVAQPSALTGFGPFFGMETYDATVNPYLLGSLGVDATTGEVLYQLQDSGELKASGAVVSFNQWNHFRLVLDFSTDTYRGYLNGAQVASTGFVDRGFGLNHFTDADITTFAAAEDAISQSLSAKAWFDNYTVRNGLPGDYNLDGVVDAADYARWKSTFGNAVSPAGNVADGNGDGIVNAADYVVWRNNLGASVASGAALSRATIPEPASTALALFAIFGITLSHRQRHSL